MTLTFNGKEYIEETKLLVGADGAFSSVRRMLAPKIPLPKYLAIQEWFKVSENLPYFSAFLIKQLPTFMPGLSRRKNFYWSVPPCCRGKTRGEV